jgi:hypothetical protein
LSDDGAVVNDLGRALIVIGLVIAVVGIVLVLAGRLPWLGRLPGDVAIQRGNWTFYAPLGTSYAPLGTSILLSLALTLILWLLGRR